jgi:hypothetical protein
VHEPIEERGDGRSVAEHSRPILERSIRSLSTLQTARYRTACKTRYQPVRYDVSWAGLTPAGQLSASPGAHYLAVRHWQVHRYFRPCGSSACAFSLGITGQLSAPR